MLTKKNIINLISKFSLILLILLYDKFCYGYQDKIVAYVNNEIITSFELNSRINLLESLNRVKIHNNQKNEIIELLIDEKLLSQIAKRNGISISENQENFYINDLLEENGFKNLHCQKKILFSMVIENWVWKNLLKNFLLAVKKRKEIDFSNFC